MSIRTELYQYAYKEDYAEKTKNVQLEKKQSLIFYIFVFIFAFIFSLPMLMNNTISWIVVTIVSLLAMFLNKKEKNLYLSSIINFANAFFYFGIMTAFAVIVNSINKFQIDCTKEMIITTLVGLMIYDIGVTINIIRKKYSQKDQTNTEVKNTRSNWNFWGPLSGGILGRLISRTFGNTSALDWFLIMASSIILILSFVFLQKYLICKIFYKKEIQILR